MLCDFRKHQFTRKKIMKRFTLAYLSLLFIIRVLAADSNSPALYLDMNQPVDTRVADLISRLTLEEKATLLNHRGPTVERFNIRADQWNQCLNGVQWDKPTTLFPICLGMVYTGEMAVYDHETEMPKA
jgi:beta-glucosidase